MAQVTKSTVVHTRLRLNGEHPDVRRDLKNVAFLHQRLLDLFPYLEDEPNARAWYRLLFRVERTDGIALLVQSLQEPDLGELPDGYATVIPTGTAPRLELAPGNTVHYRIVANPVQVVQNRRVALFGDDAVAWWRRMSGAIGLDVHEVKLRAQTVITGRMPPHLGGHRLKHQAVHFEGTAAVRVPDSVREAVVSGVGKARAYGCGLLSLWAP